MVVCSCCQWHRSIWLLPDVFWNGSHVECPMVAVPDERRSAPIRQDRFSHSIAVYGAVYGAARTGQVSRPRGLSESSSAPTIRCPTYFFSGWLEATFFMHEVHHPKHLVVFCPSLRAPSIRTRATPTRCSQLVDPHLSATKAAVDKDPSRSIAGSPHAGEAKWGPCLVIFQSE